MNIVEVEQPIKWHHPSRDDIQPILQDDGLHIHKGRDYDTGHETVVVLNDDDLTSVVIGFWFRMKKKRWGGGHFYRHYKNGVCLNWKQLTEDDKLRVLDMPLPKWARVPGKLKKDYLKPHFHSRVEYDNAGNIIAYKWLIWSDAKQVFTSGWYLERSEWVSNSLSADAIPTEKNTNGIYCAKTFNSPILQRYSTRSDVKLVKLLLSGVVLEFDHGYRAQHADILDVLP